MKNTNKRRALLVSSLVILLCLSIIAGMTYALFTDTQKVSNHLQAGDLEVTLKRTALTKTMLSATTGKLETVTPAVVDDETDDVTFTNPTDENVFGLTTDGNGNVTELIVPGSKYVATMQIENNSDVAFGYWVRIDCKDEDVEKVLAKQLEIIVYTDLNKDGVIDTEGDDAEKHLSTVSGGLEVGNDQSFIGTLACNQAENFIVSVEFVDKSYTYVDGVLTSENDAAQETDVEFDLIVYALQVK